MVKFFRQVIILFSFYFISCIGNAQDNSVEKDTVSPAQVIEYDPIPITSIVQEIENTNEELKIMENKAKRKLAVIQIVSHFPHYSNFINEQAKYTQQFIRSNPNQQKIDNLIEKWKGYRDYLEVWESEINQDANKKMALYDIIVSSEKRWNQTYLNISSQVVPEELLINVNEILKEHLKLKEQILFENSYLLKLESRINSKKSSTAIAIDDLMALKNSEVYNLFYLRHDPLWKFASEFNGSNTIDGRVAESISNNIKGMFEYLKVKENNIYLYLILLLLIALSILSIRKTFINFQMNDRDKYHIFIGKIFLQRPLQSFLFASFLVTKLFFPGSPKIFEDLLVLFILVTALPLARPFLHKHFANIYLIIIVFFLIDSVKTYFWFSTFQYRVYLLGETLLVISTIYYFTNPYLKTLKLPVSKLGILLIRSTPLLYLLSLVALFSNILGYTNLTDVATKICTQGSAITSIFVGIYILANGFGSGYIHQRYIRNRQLDQGNREGNQKKTIRVIFIATFLAWSYFFLNMTDLLSPFRSI